MTDAEITALDARIAARAAFLVEFSGETPGRAKRLARDYELRLLSAQTEFAAEMERHAREGDDRP